MMGEMMKYRCLFGFFIIGISILIIVNLALNDTFAYQYDVSKYTLFYKEDKNVLENDIRKYIDDIDDLLFVNSSYEFSDILSENYLFLVHFAMDYIINHYELYESKIVKLDKFKYMNRELNEKVTNDYIDIEEVYDITFKYFGERDFNIINNNVNIIDGYISLVDYTEKNFNLKISDITVRLDNDKVLVYVSYENDCKYLYTFGNYNNVLKINNIEVLE